MSPPPMLVVDRVEGDRAVLVAGDSRLEIPASLLPEGAKEGSVLALVLDSASTGDALAEAEARLARLRARSPVPDITEL